MPTFDLPGRVGPARLCLTRDFRERQWDLPYTTTDPTEILMLTEYGAVEVVKARPKTEPEHEHKPLPPEAQPEPKPLKPPKEV